MSKDRNNELWRRIATDACLVAAVCWFPWWVSLILSVSAFFYFEEFIELVCVGLMIDTLYAPHQAFSFFSYQYFFLALVLYFILSLAKRQLR
ncbi:MAG: hypothetical protein WCO79_02280 [bacterium]